MRRLATWLPPLLWTAVVLSFSTDDFSAVRTGNVIEPFLAWLFPSLSPQTIDLVHAVTRKGAHLTEYAILAALWLRAFHRSGAVRPPASAWLALAVAVVCAIVDETHQAFVPSRGPAAADVLLDSVGAMLAIVPARLGWGRTAELATGVLLWIALVGGLASLGISLAAGTGGGPLWITVPIAAAALLYRWSASARS
ncbi:MAG TPA: VanZ family protein [Methylomirabilota bacterium]|nr:VanZ family protein [Methylomirabilota bacterium]